MQTYMPFYYLLISFLLKYFVADLMFHNFTERLSFHLAINYNYVLTIFSGENMKSYVAFTYWVAFTLIK